MKIKTPTIIILFLFFVGLAEIQAATNDCLLDVFQAELNEKGSDKLYDYFYNRSEEDLKKAYEAWQVLYKADKNVDRLDINILEELGVYLKRSTLDIDALASHIEHMGGYNSFKKTVFWSASQTAEPYGIALLKDLESSEEIAKMLTESPDLLSSWKILYEIEVSNSFRQRSANVNAMHDYTEKIHKMEDELSIPHLKEFVKNALNKDAYMESVLFPDKLYGGIQVPQELILDIKPLHGSSDENFLRDFMQYTGTESPKGYFGAYEVRVNAGKIQRHIVDDNGVGSWKNLNGTSSEEINFVITVDGRLRFGQGHHNLSGEADYVISAGKLVITDGVVVEIGNYSGHYGPSNENLYDTEKIFKALGVTSDDFKLKFNPKAKDKASPIKNTNDNVVELWINKLNPELKSDFLKYDELYLLFKEADATQREKLTMSWEALRGYEALRKRPKHLKIIAKFSEKFKYEGEKGYKALTLVLDKISHTSYQQLNLFRSLYDIEKSFYNINDLPISISFTQVGKRFFPVIIDGIGDEIMAVEGSQVIKKKFFKKIDASYEKVGVYEGSGLYKKGNEIGFRSDVKNMDPSLKYTDETTLPSEVEPWVNSLPTDLRGDLFKFKAELYPLFRDADQEYRQSLTKSWEALQNYPQFRTTPKYLKIISKVGEKFKYEGEEGFKVLDIVRGKITEANQQKFLIESLGLLDEVFYNIKDLPFNISYKQGKEFQFITVIIDGAGDEVMNGLNDFEVMKVFNHVDESYEIVGDYEGNSIMRKGNEIGFMPSAGEEIISNEQWTMELPQELRTYLFNEEKLYQLFKNADEPYRKRLTKSWEVLESAHYMNKEWKNLIKLSAIVDRFEYNGTQGFQAMKFLFTSGLSDNYIMPLRYEMDIINAFDKLNSFFKNSDDLPISYSCIDNEMYYDPVVLDGVKDQILIIKEGKIIKKKFFDNVDDSYEKVGEYNGSDIFKKGNELGFKSADIININKK